MFKNIKITTKSAKELFHEIKEVWDKLEKGKKVKEHVIIKDDHVTIYNKDWKTKGYGKVKKAE